MDKKSQRVIVGVFGASLVLGCIAGYVVASNHGVKSKLVKRANGLIGASREKVEYVSEEAAFKMAQLTGNSQINRDWVERQWETLEY